MRSRKHALHQLAVVLCIPSLLLMFSDVSNLRFDGSKLSLRAKRQSLNSQNGYISDHDINQFIPFQNATHLTCFVRINRNGQKGWRHKIMSISNFWTSNRCQFLLGQDTVFFHQGKSGGGTFKAFDKEYKLGLQINHPAPKRSSVHGLINGPLTSLIMTIRDPVEHFVSMFNWQLLILCHPDDERLQANYSHPDNTGEFCISTRVEQERTLRETYKGDPNMLAEALCEDSGHYEQAVRDLADINHSMKISQWLQFLIDTNYNKDQGIQNFMAIPMSLNFEDDVEALILDLLRERYGSNILDARQRKEESFKREKEAKTHSSVTTWKKASSLSRLGECCLAQYYRKDYHILQTMLGEYEPAVLEPIRSAHPVLARACNWGSLKQQHICRGNLRSMLESRSEYILGEETSCAEIVR